MSNTQKILRCLMLTQSQNDHEALVAIRKANQILACLNLNWEQYLGVAKKLDEDEEPQRPMYEADAASIKMMFKEVKRHLKKHNPEPLSFIESLEKSFERYGRLTERQTEALMKFYGNTPEGKSL